MKNTFTLLLALTFFSGCHNSEIVTYKGEEFHINEILAMLEAQDNRIREISKQSLKDLKICAESCRDDYDTGIKEGIRLCQETKDHLKNLDTINNNDTITIEGNTGNVHVSWDGSKTYLIDTIQ